MRLLPAELAASLWDKLQEAVALGNVFRKAELTRGRRAESLYHQPLMVPITQQ